MQRRKELMSNYRLAMVAVLLLLVGGALACTGQQKPAVEILSPPSGSEVALGEQVEVEYRASDTTAVIRVDLEVDGEVVDSQSSPVTDGQPSMSGILRWAAEEEGTYSLIVYAYNRDRVSSDPVGVNVVVSGEGPVPGSTVTISLLVPGATHTPGETTTPQPTGVTATATRPPVVPTATRPAPTPTTPPPTATRPQAPPPPTATPPPPMANLWVSNDSGIYACEIFFSRPGQAWGANRLPGGLGHGESALFTVNEGNYDLRAVDCNQNELSLVWNQPIYGSFDWVIPPMFIEMAAIRVSNWSVSDICELYLVPTGEAVTFNEVEGNPILSGEERTFDVPAGSYAVEMWACGLPTYQLAMQYDVFISGLYEYFVVDPI